MHMAWVLTPGIPRHQHHMVMQYNEENICTHSRKNICTHHTSMAHVINKQDLEDYISVWLKKGMYSGPSGQAEGTLCTLYFIRQSV